MEQDKLDISRSIQESLLTLLAKDDERCLIIRNSIPANSFDGLNREVVREIYDYIDKEKEAPKAHLDEVLDRFLEKKDTRAKRVSKMIKNIHMMYNSGLNAEYVMGRLERHLRYHNIKFATQELIEVFSSGKEDDTSIDKMEDIINKAVRSHIETFNPGTRLSDKKQARKSISIDNIEDVFPTGIKELDDHKLGPRRKQLHLLLGLKKIGKTRWLAQLGERAAMQDAKVLHISLEMDEERMLRRYYQSFFGIARERKEIRRKKFKKDEFGRLIKIADRKSKVRLALDDSRIWPELEKRIERRRRILSNIVIKTFPTRQLTFRGLVAYLDRLEIQEKFIPDLLIIDYPKLMNIDIKNFRLSLGALLEDLRGLGVERNIAIATVAQAHRMRSTQEGVIESSDIGEDFSQTQTLDVGLIFRQSKIEADLGLARILVSDARDAPAGWEVLIAQNYDQGQFCVSSVRMNKDYWNMIRAQAGVDEGEEGEEE